MWQLLQLSNSRAILVGAVVVDTICFGTLALLLMVPSVVLGESASTTVLISVAITAPVLALGIAAMAGMVPKRFDAEERARRSILAGTVLHIGVQASAVISILCQKGPASLSAYVLHELLWMFLLLVPMGIFFAIWNWRLVHTPAVTPQGDQSPGACRSGDLSSNPGLPATYRGAARS